jgi:anti-sigma factor RsiW
MSDTGCERAREAIPGLVAGRLEAQARTEVEAHLGTCADCREEAELAALLVASRPPVPAGLARRIDQAVRAHGGASRRPWWGLAAAAVAVLALGIGVASRQSGSTTEPPAYLADTETENLWLSDDGLIAGAPALDALSEDALVQLLDELSSEGQA